MSALRTLIIDDEPLARSRIRKLLDREHRIQVVAECANGAEALAAIERHDPDLLFLDVQMPDLDGFEVLGRLPRGCWPQVIFVTAYDQYALRAFDVHAVDYLLKPFDNDRFRQALDRAARRVEVTERAELHDRLVRVLDEYQRERRGYREAVEIRWQGSIREIPLGEVALIQSAGNYVTLHRGDEELLHRTTLSALAAELDPERFVRVHRSRVVNLDHVRATRYLGDGRYRFILTSGAELESGRSYRNEASEAVARLVD